MIGRTLDEIAGSTRARKDDLRVVLEDERRRGHVTEDREGRWSLSASFETLAGPALRNLGNQPEGAKR